MFKEPESSYDEDIYTDDFEPPSDWEPVRNSDGKAIPGCWRTPAAPDSDSL